MNQKERFKKYLAGDYQTFESLDKDLWLVMQDLGWIAQPLFDDSKDIVCHKIVPTSVPGGFFALYHPGDPQWWEDLSKAMRLLRENGIS